MFQRRVQGRQPQYGPRSWDNSEYCPYSPQADNRGRPALPVGDRGDSYDRLDEGERSFYEFSQSVHDSQLWKNYRERVEQIEADLLEEMTYYQRNPDKHPKYEYEWKDYWSGRTAELLRNGEDPMNYDIKVEFFAFWDVKLRELFQDIFRKEKAHLQQQLQVLHVRPSGNFMNDRRAQSNTQDQRSFTSNKRNYGSVNHDNKIQSSDPSNKRIKPSDESKDSTSSSSSDVSTIPVLRQLSVLENHLGSLGPKVVDLLSKALVMEKSSSANSVLSNEENSVMLETVKEKLKGLLQAGLMPQAVVAATETGIRNIENLLKTVPTGKKEKSHLDEKPSVSGKRPYDKKPYLDEKKPFVDKKPVTDGRQLYQGEVNDYREERHHYEDKGKSNQNKGLPHAYNQRNSTRDKNLSQNLKSYKVSEINYCVEQLKFLSNLSFMEKTYLAQDIAKSLLLQGQTDILEDDLLDLIHKYSSRRQESSGDNFGRQTSEAYQQRSRAYDQILSGEVPQRNTVQSKSNTLYELDSLYRTNQSGQEASRSFYPDGSRSSGRMNPITYPLKTNPYQPDSHRNY